MSKRRNSLPAASDDEMDVDKRPKYKHSIEDVSQGAAPFAWELEGAAAPSAAAPSAAPSLYDDVLCVLFSFLSFAELTRACVCRTWRHAAIKMPCREDGNYWTDIVIPPMDVSSRVDHFPVARKHVRSLHSAWRSAVTNVAQMQALVAFLPELHDLSLHVHIRSLHPNISQLFAASMRFLTLHITIVGEAWSWPAGIQMMKTVCVLTKLTFLELNVSGDEHYTNRIVSGPAAFFEPLLQLPDLTELEISWDNFSNRHPHENDDDHDDDWADESIDVLRSLPKLERITMEIRNLAYFFRTPHSLKLRTLNRDWCVRNRILNTQWLEQLPSLTEFRSNLFDFNDPSFLGRIPGLKCLEIDCNTFLTPPLHALVSALSECASLTELRVDHPQFDGTAIQNMMLTQTTPSTPTKAFASLTSLRINVRNVDADVADPFRFLSIVPLFGAQLQHLVVYFNGSPHVPVTSYQHLYALRALRSIYLVGALRSPIPQNVLATFRPRSPTFRADCFPYLHTFNW